MSEEFQEWIHFDVVWMRRALQLTTSTPQNALEIFNKAWRYSQQTPTASESITESFFRVIDFKRAMERGNVVLEGQLVTKEICYAVMDEEFVLWKEWATELDQTDYPLQPQQGVRLPEPQARSLLSRMEARASTWHSGQSVRL